MNCYIARPLLCALFVLQVSLSSDAFAKRKHWDGADEGRSVKPKPSGAGAGDAASAYSSSPPPPSRLPSSFSSSSSISASSLTSPSAVEVPAVAPPALSGDKHVSPKMKDCLNSLPAYRSRDLKAMADARDCFFAYIAARGDVNALDAYGWNAVHSAAYMGDTTLLKAFLAAGGSRNYRTVHSLRTPLMLAYLAGRTDAVSVLVNDIEATPSKELFDTTLISLDGKNIYHYVLMPFYFKNRLYQWPDSYAQKVVERLAHITRVQEGANAHLVFNHIDNGGLTPLDHFLSLSGRSSVFYLRLRSLGFMGAHEVAVESKAEVKTLSDEKTQADARHHAAKEFDVLMEALKKTFAQHKFIDVGFVDLARFEELLPHIDIGAQLFNSETLLALAAGATLAEGAEAGTRRVNPGLLQLALHLGLDINTVSSFVDEAPLTVAVLEGKPATVQYLLQLGADPIYQDGLYRTALHWLFDKIGVIEAGGLSADVFRIATMLIEAMLLAGGQDALNVLDEDGNSPLALLWKKIDASQIRSNIHIAYFRSRGAGVFVQPDSVSAIRFKKRALPIKRPYIPEATVHAWLRKSAFSTGDWTGVKGFRAESASMESYVFYGFGWWY
jgi:ankyrin repeat protein